MASTYTVGGSAWVETTGPADKRTTRVAWRGETVTVADDDPRLAHALDKGHLVVAGQPPTGSSQTDDAERDLVDVEQFHTGAGWYQIGDQKVRGEDAARQALADLEE